MRLILNITIEGEPVPKQRPRFSGKGRVYTPRQTVQGELAVAWNIKRVLRGREPDTTNAFAVEAEFYCASSKTDCDNLLKLLLDSANKLVWQDDRQVEKLTATLHRKAETPRTVLRVYVI